jgi:hypothetical protein
LGASRRIHADQNLFDPAGSWLGVHGRYDIVRLSDGYLVAYIGSEMYFNHINHLSWTTAFKV